MIGKVPNFKPEAVITRGGGGGVNFAEVKTITGSVD